VLWWYDARRDNPPVEINSGSITVPLDKQDITMLNVKFWQARQE
jgi:hypothetical protein